MESDRIQNQLKRVQLLKKVREKGTEGEGKTTQREGERIHEVDFDFDEGDQLDKRIQMLQQKVLVAPEFEGLWAGDNNGDFDPEDDAALEKVVCKHNIFVYQKRIGGSVDIPQDPDRHRFRRQTGHDRLYRL